jgi:hypothetical protein
MICVFARTEYTEYADLHRFIFLTTENTKHTERAT